MPSYAFICKQCKKSFNVTMTLAEYGNHKVACPSCKSKNVEQKPAAFFAVSAKKS